MSQAGQPAQYELRCLLHAPLPLDQTFAAFEDPRNLARITPPWLRFEIRSSDRLDMKVGLEIDYTIRWIGLPMRWRSVISDYEAPYRFVDEQVIGPYAYWRHLHEFKSAEGGTLVADRVRYSLPMGPLGRVAHRVAVGRQLLAIFRFRQKAMAQLLGTECTTVEAPRISLLRQAADTGREVYQDRQSGEQSYGK
jgi:ligand-binding SRPBCC domain-containing protein